MILSPFTVACHRRPMEDDQEEDQEDGWVRQSDLPAREPLQSLREAARAWAARNDAKLKHISREIIARRIQAVSGKATLMVYSGCSKHDQCNARFRFISPEEEVGYVDMKWHSKESPHSACSAAVRSDARHPVTHEQMEQVRAEAVDKDGRKRRPLEVQMQLQNPLPAGAVRRGAAGKRQRKSGPALTAPRLLRQIKRTDLSVLYRCCWGFSSLSSK